MRQLVWWVGGISFSLVSVPVMAVMSSVGESGINAQRLHEVPYNLTGRKIAIGQVEIGRPAQFGLDKAGASNQSVRPGRLFVGDDPAQANDYVDAHAANVASLMISEDKTVKGVAPDAVLYAAAVGSESGGDQPAECLAAQTVAFQNGGDVRAINYSFGESLTQDPRPNAVLDGNALLTQCVDWSARVHNVLHVIAGNQGRGGYPIPTDTYNGVVIANSMRRQGQFTKVDFFSLGSEPEIVLGRDPATESNVGARRSVSLVAPGSDLETLSPDGEIAPPASGTSFAAPHVTATVALLQEFGDRAIRAVLEEQGNLTNSPWTLDARRQEVMKAVLMNSADKIADQGDGRRLQMSRTLVNQRNQDWLQSDAYRTQSLPLDAQMGTGHLNAFRAYQQFSAGQWSPDRSVPAMGWDYRSVEFVNDAETSAYQDYVIESPLEAGSFISATLAWNRLVELQDRNNNGQYDIGETFSNRGLNNLDIYLMRAEEEDTAQSVWSSVSRVDSVEHLFYAIPATGQYKIRVVFRDRVNDVVQPYALAWWAVPIQQGQ